MIEELDKNSDLADVISAVNEVDYVQSEKENQMKKKDIKQWLTELGKNELADSFYFNEETNKLQTDTKAVDLTGLGLTELPDIFDNVAVDVLDLSNNEIEKIPESFANMTCRNLLMSFNKVTEVPESFCKNSFNAVLLDSNKISKLPDNIGDLRTNVLRLDCNEIEHVPDSFGNLISDVVRMDCNKIEVSKLDFNVFDPEHIEEIRWENNV